MPAASDPLYGVRPRVAVRRPSNTGFIVLGFMLAFLLGQIATWRLAEDKIAETQSVAFDQGYIQGSMDQVARQSQSFARLKKAGICGYARLTCTSQPTPR